MSSAARANIAEYRNQATMLKEKDQVIKTGLKIFNIEHPLSKDLKRFEMVRNLQACRLCRLCSLGIVMVC